MQRLCVIYLLRYIQDIHNLTGQQSRHYVLDTLLLEILGYTCSRNSNLSRYTVLVILLRYIYVFQLFEQ